VPGVHASRRRRRPRRARLGLDELKILVVNAGSSSLKLRLLEDDRLLAAADLDPDDEAGVAAWLDAQPAPDATGHRVVHGGVELVEPVLVDDAVVSALTALTDLAPLHQPKSLAALALISRLLPDVPAVACFDTAFHATLLPAAATYALPAQWRRRWHLRKYGFHGLSHEYASRRARELGAGPRLVTCHLGAGASLCAVLDGKSVDTTMGFTPLDGLVMATRSGTVDPGLVLWLQEHAGMPAAELADTLEHRSGLLGLAGSADMRELLARTDDDAALALNVYTHRLRTLIGAMAAALGGIDAVVFTGGVGERSSEIRARACERLDYLGVKLDEKLNDGNGDRKIGAGAFVVNAREDLEIARQTRAVLTRSSG
jgi:acetate kinase